MPITMRSEDGRVISVDEADARFYADRGFVAETPESGFARFKGEAATTPDRGLVGTLNAAGTSLLSGATLGLSDVALGATLDDSERKRLLAERAANPISSAVGNVVGTIAPAILAPESLLGRAPAGYLGRAAAEGFEAGRAAGGIGGAAKAAAYTGAEGAVQNAGAYLADVALGDRQLSAEGLSGALGTGFAFGSAAGGAILGIEKGSIAARRMFARTAEGGEQAAVRAEETWKTASRETIQANDTAAEIARAKLTEARDATTRARVAQQQAKAGEIDARAALEAEARTAALGPPPSPAALQTEAEKLGPLVAEYDAAKAELDDVLRRLQAPDIEPGIVPQTPGVPVAEFGAPGARGYAPGEVKAPGPPSVVEAKTGDVTAVGKKKFGQGTPVGERSSNLTQQLPTEAPSGLRFDPETRTYHDAAPVSDLESQLAAMKSKLDEGVDLKTMGAPARAEYAANKAAKTEEAAAHFRAKATGSDLDPFFANLTRPKTRDAYVAQNIGAAMRSEGSHAAGLAKLEREWAEMSGHPLSVRNLEQRLDEATERATAAADPVERVAAQAEAQSVERQLSLVGARPSAVDDIAAVAKVATRYEKASAEVTEALGDAAPPAAKQAAKVFRDAEADAERKMMDRATRAVEDHVEAQPTAKERFATARSKRIDADAAVAKARAAEGEAKLGDIAARRAAKESKQAAATIGLPSSPASPAGTKLGGLADIGAVLEVADSVGIPGLPSPHDIPVIGPLLGVYLKYRALKATAGRFVGRVPVTGEARAATLAARTKDKIAVAVDRSLGLVAKAAPKARAPAVALTEVLQRRAFDDGEPDAPKGASMTAQAAVRIREIATAATRPDLVVSQVRRELAGINDPDLIAAAEKHRIAVYQYLNKVAPELPQANPYTKIAAEPSPAAAMKFARQVEAAFDPVSVFEALHQQTLTPEAAETLRATSPKLFGMAQDRLLSRAGDLTEPVPYKQLLRNGLLFDVPLHPSMQADNAAVLQSVHAPKPMATGVPQPAAPPAPSIAGNTNLTNLYQPGLDRRSAMR